MREKNLNCSYKPKLLLYTWITLASPYWPSSWNPSCHCYIIIFGCSRRYNRVFFSTHRAWGGPPSLHLFSVAASIELFSCLVSISACSALFPVPTLTTVGRVGPLGKGCRAEEEVFSTPHPWSDAQCFHVSRCHICCKGLLRRSGADGRDGQRKSRL